MAPAVSGSEPAAGVREWPAPCRAPLPPLPGLLLPPVLELPPLPSSSAPSTREQPSEASSNHEPRTSVWRREFIGTVDSERSL